MSSITSLAYTLHRGVPVSVFWKELDRALAGVFGHRLFTVLAFDQASGLLGRLYSSRPDINPVGGRKRVTESRWTQQVLQEGKIFRGANRDDIKAVFSDYEVLWSVGCESVLNIPVRKNGATLGSLNLLGAAGQYNDADIELAYVFAQLTLSALETARAERHIDQADLDGLEKV